MGTLTNQQRYLAVFGKVFMQYMKISHVKKNLSSPSHFSGLLTVSCFEAGSVDLLQTHTKPNTPGTEGDERHRMGRVLEIKHG